MDEIPVFNALTSLRSKVIAAFTDYKAEVLSEGHSHTRYKGIRRS